MTQRQRLISRSNLRDLGLENGNEVYFNPSRKELIRAIRSRYEGQITGSGSIVVNTGEFTGRSPRDKFVVKSDVADQGVWWGSVNQPLGDEKFKLIHEQQLEYLKEREVFVQHLFTGNAHSSHLFLRVITDTAWPSLFALNLFKSIPPDLAYSPENAFTILHTPRLRIDPVIAGTNSGVFIVIHLEKRMILIGGTGYAGEIKKSVFSAMNYLFPRQGILTMHCSANTGRNGDVALFFGLSGTGKTTLSTSPDRDLIGDDEHGWSESGIFNLEGGCYAKTIHLDQKKEPVIWRAVHRKGAILENVPYEPGNGYLDFDSVRFTENTRAAYPLSFVTKEPSCRIYDHPRNIFFLTADAFGVLPPISLLTREQAIYQFLSGYTSKLAGTEQGLGKEPRATFSACFAEPFLVLDPKVYAGMLQERLAKYNPRVWLVNTGWVAGPCGTGHRIKLETTRALIQAALDGKIDVDHCLPDPIFDFSLPCSVANVDTGLLNPRDQWENKSDYDLAAKDLKAKFTENYARFQ